MSLIPSCLLSRAAELAATALPDTCNIIRAGTATDTSDGPQPDWDNPVTVASAVACRIDTARLRPQERMNAGTTQSNEYYYLALPAGQACLAGYRIVVTSKSNRTFEVLGINAGSFEVERVVDVVEIGRTVA